jgi:hypothetical protein
MRKSTVTAIIFALVLYMGLRVQDAAAGDRSFRAALVVAAIAAILVWRRLPS